MRANGLWVALSAWVGCVGCVETAAPHAPAESDGDAGSLLGAASLGPEKPASGAAYAGKGAAAVRSASAGQGQGGAGALGASSRGASGKSVSAGAPAGAAAADGGGASSASHPSPVTAADGGERVGALPSRAGALVISELMIDPSARSDAEGEWFELYNASGELLDLAGCSIADGSAQSHAVTAHVAIPAQGFISVARGEQPGFTPDVVTSFSLKNSADVLEVACAGLTIDRFEYDKTRGFPFAPGSAMSLDPSSLDSDRNDDAAAWCLAVDVYATDLGSPGRPNPPCGADQDAGVTTDLAKIDGERDP